MNRGYYPVTTPLHGSSTKLVNAIDVVVNSTKREPEGDDGLCHRGRKGTTSLQDEHENNTSNIKRGVTSDQSKTTTICLLLANVEIANDGC
ncbi:hypothetical protein J6590_103407 [Homalodisca vitripennis]|nr:hypothetical protein J6590_103407 [Homalodisca vitripennis]